MYLEQVMQMQQWIEGLQEPTRFIVSMTIYVRTSASMYRIILY